MTHPNPDPNLAALAEQGRRLASQREDLIVAGANPADLAVPLHPTPCPTCTWPRRETTGMVCQTCGRDYGARAYQPPVDVDFGAPLPHRHPKIAAVAAGEPHTFELAGYSLLAGVHDGRPFVRAPGANTDEVLAALQSVVDALEADA